MKRIIVIDDCKLTTAIARNMLLSAGYDVAVAENGLAANRFLYQTPRPSMVLVDVEMPLLPGDRVVKLLKEDSWLQGVPIILMSHKEEEELERLCSASGADGFIVKPLRKPTLLPLVAHYAGAGQEGCGK